VATNKAPARRPFKCRWHQAEMGSRLMAELIPFLPRTMPAKTRANPQPGAPSAVRPRQGHIRTDLILLTRPGRRTARLRLYPVNAGLNPSPIFASR